MDAVAGAVGEGGGGSGRRRNGCLILVSMVCSIVQFVAVRPQELKELCGGREGQTTYYVERKTLRCDPGKATLIKVFIPYLNVLEWR